VPQPYPGQKWKHGWIPLTPGAAREKNHGKKPGGGSLIARMVAEAAETHQRMLARDREREAKASATRAATRSADDALRSAAKNRPAQTVEAMPSAPAAPTKAAGMRDGLRWTSDEDGLAWARKNLPLPDLTDDEKKAVRQYTLDHVNEYVNGGLRGDPVPAYERDNYNKVVKDLDSALSKSSLPESIIVHRGVGDGYIAHLGADPGKPETMEALVGRDFKEQAFMSTSVGATAAFDDEPVQLMMRVPKGHKAMNIMPLSREGEDEREVLLARNSRYVIHAAYKHGDTWHIEAEVVPADWKKPAGWAPNPYGDAHAGYS
jgi:hypothetical protein